MVSKWDDDQSPEATQSESTSAQSYAADSSQTESSESYPRLLSNQTSDVLDMLDSSSSETSTTSYKYMDGQQQYGQDYGQSDSGSAA